LQKCKQNFFFNQTISEPVFTLLAVQDET